MFKMVERALEACRLPVSRVCVQNKMLRIHLDRAEVMKTFLPRVAREGLKYGANALLKEVSCNQEKKDLLYRVLMKQFYVVCILFHEVYKNIFATNNL